MESIPGWFDGSNQLELSRSRVCKINRKIAMQSRHHERVVASNESDDSEEPEGSKREIIGMAEELDYFLGFKVTLYHMICCCQRKKFIAFF